MQLNMSALSYVYMTGFDVAVMSHRCTQTTLERSSGPATSATIAEPHGLQNQSEQLSKLGA